MDFAEHSRAIISELEGVMSGVGAGPGAELAQAIVSARRVFVAGCGRTGLMARAFAMRLMHLGLTAHVAGDSTSPAIGEGDLLVMCSGSGEKQTLLSFAGQAKASGARCAVVTASAGSPIASAAELVVLLDAKNSRQFGGSLFEQSLLIFFDALVMALTLLCGTNHDEMALRHANLE